MSLRLQPPPMFDGWAGVYGDVNFVLRHALINRRHHAYWTIMRLAQCWIHPTWMRPEHVYGNGVYAYIGMRL